MDALRSVLPAGTLSGAPKVRAMQIIDELEPVKRGGYGGAIGYLSYTGDLDTAIHIRTLVVKDGVAHVQAGGGTVADAKPDYEYDESVAKSQRRAARDRAGVRAAGLGMRSEVLVIDNYDSFTYNLVQYLGELGAEVEAVRNDRATVAELVARGYDRVVVSPGPCTPDEAGISLEVVRALPEAGDPDARRVPRPPGARAGLRRASCRDPPVHGKAATIEHDGRTIFDGLRSPLTVGRYHSLVVERRPARRAGGERPRRRRDHGRAPPRAAGRGRPVPPRVRADRAGPRAAAQLPGRPARGGRGGARIA